MFFSLDPGTQQLGLSLLLFPPFLERNDRDRTLVSRFGT